MWNFLNTKTELEVTHGGVNASTLSAPNCKVNAQFAAQNSFFIGLKFILEHKEVNITRYPASFKVLLGNLAGVSGWKTQRQQYSSEGSSQEAHGEEFSRGMNSPAPPLE